jgi:hypothetical protein
VHVIRCLKKISILMMTESSFQNRIQNYSLLKVDRADRDTQISFEYRYYCMRGF